MRHILIGLLCVIILACSSTGMKWGAVSTPTKNVSQSFGSYSAGCLDGAVSLSAFSDKYQPMRIARQRYFGHPRLIHFLDSYSTTVIEKGLGILAIGDLSQARGGPMPGGHASHQTGLDADIWFKRFMPSERVGLSLEEVNSLSAVSVINADALTINSTIWNEDNVSALKVAASYSEVERVFVNFVIKKQLCEKHKGEEWLSKIRPWWGHTAHYHVRLSCAEDNEFCQAQQAVDNNDGCDDTLDWWYSEEARITSIEETPIEKEIILPSQCNAVLTY